MNDPLVAMSWGELLDRATILDIKLRRLRSAAAREAVIRERAALDPMLAQLANVGRALTELRAELAAVNDRLWLIEDGLRDRAAADDFGPDFVAVARSVLHENAERSRLKQVVNALLGSNLAERKQYGSADIRTGPGD